MLNLRDKFIFVLSSASGLGMCAYVCWSIWHGCIRLSSRSTDVVIYQANSPEIFWLTVAIYVFGALFFFWIARGVLKD